MTADPAIPDCQACADLAGDPAAMARVNDSTMEDWMDVPRPDAERPDLDAIEERKYTRWVLVHWREPADPPDWPEQTSLSAEDVSGEVRELAAYARALEAERDALRKLLRVAFSYADNDAAYWTEGGGRYGALNDEERRVMGRAGIDLS